VSSYEYLFVLRSDLRSGGEVIPVYFYEGTMTWTTCRSAATRYLSRIAVNQRLAAVVHDRKEGHGETRVVRLRLRPTLEAP
jgi:hypothetical protein